MDALETIVNRHAIRSRDEVAAILASRGEPISGSRVWQIERRALAKLAAVLAESFGEKVPDHLRSFLPVSRRVQKKRLVTTAFNFIPSTRKPVPLKYVRHDSGNIECHQYACHRFTAREAARLAGVRTSAILLAIERGATVGDRKLTFEVCQLKAAEIEQAGKGAVA